MRDVGWAAPSNHARWRVLKLRIVFRPEGAATNQPRATPWEGMQNAPPALKGRHKERLPQFVVPFQGEGDLMTPRTQGGAPRLSPLRSALG